MRHDLPPASQDWVHAAPFGAHLRYLATTTGVPWAVVARHAGVPVRLAARLMRHPYPARLPRVAAHRLLSVSPEGLAGLRSAWVPGEPTRIRLDEIRRRGHDPVALARRVGIPARVIEPALEESAGVRLVSAVAVQVLLEFSDRLSTGRSLAATAVA